MGDDRTGENRIHLCSQNKTYSETKLVNNGLNFFIFFEPFTNSSDSIYFPPHLLETFLGVNNREKQLDTFLAFVLVLRVERREKNWNRPVCELDSAMSQQLYSNWNDVK